MIGLKKLVYGTEGSIFCFPDVARRISLFCVVELLTYMRDMWLHFAFGVGVKTTSDIYVPKAGRSDRFVFEHRDGFC